MAVPSSGPISLYAIANEVDGGDYDEAAFQGAVSLTDFSTGAGDASAINQSNASANRPNGSVPHAMSEFYSYDHDFNPFSSVIANFTLSGAQSTINPPFSVQVTVNSDLKTFTLANAAGALTALIASSNPSYGTLQISLSQEGDPGTAGTGNNATGYVAEGTTLSYSPSWASASVTVYVRVRYLTHTSSANQTRTCTFTNNGQTDVVNITKITQKSDRRLKTNIEMIGHSPSKIPIYTFNYKTDLTIKYKGVMAQDLLEMGITEPVIMGDDGFYGVDYSKIDVDMEIIS
jgi:hypothetical protein